MIPAEAVEAAAKVLWEPNERDDEWVGEYETYKDYLRAQAIKALEAAAPHMQDARIERVKDLCAEEEARQTAKAYIPVDAIRAALRTTK